ncbi:hypothetical protein BDV98DRAFT_601413 [Pterulicium gracile]|uniref:Uncharacterized protein n=1 Tax=Pterulicium gracile TaxID=1884261 RepID=A0A5C3QSJ6_9AGAR|nr:hypothetical protein BDV98DRAFT_601413 [Pterula gracilis]
MPGFHANASHTLYSEQAILTLPSELTSSVLATGAMNAANVTYITKLPAEILLEVWIHLIDMPLQEVKKTDTARVDISPIPISALHLSQTCARTGSTTTALLSPHSCEAVAHPQFPITLAFSPLDYIQLDHVHDNLHRFQKITVDFGTRQDPPIEAGNEMAIQHRIFRTRPQVVTYLGRCWTFVPEASTALALTSFSIHRSDASRGGHRQFAWAVQIINRASNLEHISIRGISVSPNVDVELLYIHWCHLSALRTLSLSFKCDNIGVDPLFFTIPFIPEKAVQRVVGRLIASGKPSARLNLPLLHTLKIGSSDCGVYPLHITFLTFVSVPSLTRLRLSPEGKTTDLNASVAFLSRVLALTEVPFITRLTLDMTWGNVPEARLIEYLKQEKVQESLRQLKIINRSLPDDDEFAPNEVLGDRFFDYLTSPTSSIIADPDVARVQYRLPNL